MSTELKRCGCGWERPLISVTSLDGSLPSSSIVPVYNCPRCGTSYRRSFVTYGPRGGLLRTELAELVLDALP